MPFIFETGNLPLIGSVLSALVIFLVVGVAVICAWRKKQNSKPTKKGTLYFITYFAQIAFWFFRIYGIVSFLNTFLISCQEFIDNCHISVKYADTAILLQLTQKPVKQLCLNEAKSTNYKL